MKSYCIVLLGMILYLSGGEKTMFKFTIDDQNKYKGGDAINCKVFEYIDESADILAQHLSLVYGKVLQTAIEFDIDERIIIGLAFEYLEDYYPEVVKKLIRERMKRGDYYDHTKME